MLGRIVTFYSYKGGTGRSMALANFAWIMAASGKRVLVIDWDLEAPGLHRYFRPFLVDPDLLETDGLIDMFWTFATSAFGKTVSGEWSTVDQKAEVAESLDDSTRRLDARFFPKNHDTGAQQGYIDFVGAGRQGSTYSERVNSFDWKRFYELGGAEILSEVKNHLRDRYDWVLIDSRTGVSDTSGICTMQMPQTVVAFFTLNRQSIEGVAAILGAIRSYRSASVDGSKIGFFPVATRIENAEQAKLEIARNFAREKLKGFLPFEMQSRPREYWDKMEIAYRPAYAFEEVLAAFGDATGAAGASDTMLAQVEATAQQITGDYNLRMPEIVEADRQDVLAKYAFGTLTVALPKETETADDTEFLRSVRKKEQSWRASDFYWRRLLSSRELDLLTAKDKEGFGRGMLYYLAQSEKMQALLKRARLTGPLILALLFVLSITLLSTLKEQLFYSPWSIIAKPIYYVVGFVLLWLSSVFISSLVASPTPHGIRRTEVFSLFLMGPLHPAVPDYNPERDEPSASRAPS